MQRGTATLFLLIAGLVVAGLIGIFLIFSPNIGLISLPFLSPSPPPSPVVSLKAPTYPPKLSTYSNQKLGFKFQYPNAVSVQEDSEEDFNQRAAGSASKTGNGNFRKNFTDYVGYEPGKFVGAVVVVDETESFESNPFTVWVFDNPEKLDDAGWFEKYWYYPFLWGVFSERDKGHVRAEKIATISGQTTKYAIISYQSGAPKYFYLTSGNKMFLLRILTSQSIGDQILSSFKFL